MLLFILAVNAISFGKPCIKTSGGKGFSAMAFKEMGMPEEKIKKFLESEKPFAKFFRYLVGIFFFLFIIGLVFSIDFIFRHIKLIFKTGSTDRPVSWGVLDILRVVIIVVFTGYILAIAEEFILKMLHFNIDINLRMILSTFFIDITALIAILYFVLVKCRENLFSLGLRLRDFSKNILIGASAYIFILPLLISVLFLSVFFLSFLGYKPPPQPIFDLFFEEKRRGVLLFLTIFVSVLGPVIEEVFFRGFMYNTVKKRFGVLIAMLLSAGVFSALHTNIAGFLPIMILGILMAYLYEKTSSLIPSIAVHILHNSIIVGFVFLVKELLR